MANHLTNIYGFVVKLMRSKLDMGLRASLHLYRQLMHGHHISVFIRCRPCFGNNIGPCKNIETIELTLNTSLIYFLIIGLRKDKAKKKFSMRLINEKPMQSPHPTKVGNHCSCSHRLRKTCHSQPFVQASSEIHELANLKEDVITG